MATMPRVNLGTCHPFFTVENLYLPSLVVKRGWVGQKPKVRKTLCNREARVQTTAMARV